jgi:hypothetical protein
MRDQEADWITRTLALWPAERLSPCLNLGCGYVAEWRDQGMFLELRRRGLELIHVDRNPFPGVDIACDLFERDCQDRLKSLHPRSALLTNVLEHLPRQLLGRVPSILREILAEDGILIVAVPRSFPYHADPIDTLYRPSADELAGLFAPAGFELLRSETLQLGSFLDDLRAGGAKNWAHWLFRLAKPFRRRDKWLNAAHSLLWLFRSYEESLVVLRRRAAAEPA